MDEPSEPVLDYAKPSRFKLSLSRGGSIRLFIYGTVLLLVVGFIHGPTSGQIRLDTGDLQYCWFEIPLRYERMPEPERSKLLSLSASSPRLPGSWVTCVTFPHGGTDNPESGFHLMFKASGIWASEDPHIARWLLEDVQFRVLRGARASPEAEEMIGGLLTTDYIAGRGSSNWARRPPPDRVLPPPRLHTSPSSRDGTPLAACRFSLEL